MILNHISVLNYKNLDQVELSFSPKVNCFIGQNGMGKTNLLDAIYYLSFCNHLCHIRLCGCIQGRKQRYGERGAALQHLL